MSIRYRQIRRYRMSNRRRYVPQIDKLVSIRCRNEYFRCRFSKEIELLPTSTKYRQDRYQIDVESTNHFWLGSRQVYCRETTMLSSPLWKRAALISSASLPRSAPCYSWRHVTLSTNESVLSLPGGPLTNPFNRLC